MDRDEALGQLDGSYDILIIGGGATGLGIAVDASTRGYRTLLVTADDFAQATSSRSTKLIHGGVRYLERGEIKLVRESLRERGLLLRNAPTLVHDLRFFTPCYKFWQIGYYGAGLKLYDLLAGSLNLSPSAIVGRRRSLTLVPALQAKGLKGGVSYSDGQFNDARLAMALARTAYTHGAILANYARVTALIKGGSRLRGAVVLDQVSGREHMVGAKVVVNATGIFTDVVRAMDDPSTEPIVVRSRGSHIVLGHEFLPGKVAILVPRTDDGRVAFIMPWEGRTLVGTTDVPVDGPELEPVPSDEEIDFLLDAAALYLTRAPQRADVLAAFAGLRPLVRRTAASTARFSRDHALLVSDSGLVSITGGKWTTYRLMAQDTVDLAARIGGLPARPCVTERSRLAGAETTDPQWRELGATDDEIVEYEARHSGLVHRSLPYSLAMAAYVIDREMPVNLDDVLSRRLRALLLGAVASIEAGPAIAKLMAERHGHGDDWIASQIERYRLLAGKYLPGNHPTERERAVHATSGM